MIVNNGLVQMYDEALDFLNTLPEVIRKTEAEQINKDFTVTALLTIADALTDWRDNCERSKSI